MLAHMRMRACPENAMSLRRLRLDREMFVRCTRRLWVAWKSRQRGARGARRPPGLRRPSLTWTLMASRYVLPLLGAARCFKKSRKCMSCRCGDSGGLPQVC